jgi:hypothetical protein
MIDYKVFPTDKWYPMKGTVSISRTTGGSTDSSVRISVRDELSGIEFVEIELSVEAFGSAITGLSSVKGRMLVNGLKHVGKKHERTTAKIEIPKELYSNRPKIKKWLEENAQREGWILSTYLGSQNSIVADYKEDKHYANISYHRYVDPGPTHGKNPEDHDQVQG